MWRGWLIYGRKVCCFGVTGKLRTVFASDWSHTNDWQRSVTSFYTGRILTRPGCCKRVPFFSFLTCRALTGVYLSTCCQPVSGISGRRHLRSADRGHLDFPRVKLASYRGRSFAYAGPSNWNSLPARLRDSSLSLSSFRRHLKTFLFSFY